MLYTAACFQKLKSLFMYKKNLNSHLLFNALFLQFWPTVQQFLNGITYLAQTKVKKSESFVDEKRLVMTSRFCLRNSSSIVSIFLRDIHPSFSKIATLFEVSPTVSFSFLRILAKAHSWTTTHCFEFCPKKLLKPCSKT